MGRVSIPRRVGRASGEPHHALMVGLARGSTRPTQFTHREDFLSNAPKDATLDRIEPLRRRTKRSQSRRRRNRNEPDFENGPDAAFGPFFEKLGRMGGRDGGSKPRFPDVSSGTNPSTNPKRSQSGRSLGDLGSRSYREPGRSARMSSRAEPAALAGVSLGPRELGDDVDWARKVDRAVDLAGGRWWSRAWAWRAGPSDGWGISRMGRSWSRRVSGSKEGRSPSAVGPATWPCIPPARSSPC